MENKQNTYLIFELGAEVKAQYIESGTSIHALEGSIVLYDIIEGKQTIKAFIPKTYTVILLE